MKTKIVQLCWTEIHSYEQEVEIPDELETNEDIIDYVTNNADGWVFGAAEPYEINTDWDSFRVFEKEETK